MPVKVLPAAGADRERIRQGLEGLENHVGVASMHTMSPTDHNGLQVEGMRMVIVEENAFRLVGR